MTIKDRLLEWVDRWFMPYLAIGGVFFFGYLVGTSLDFFYHGPPIYCGEPKIISTHDGWQIIVNCFKN